MNNVSLVAFHDGIEHPGLDEYPRVTSRFYADKGFEFHEDGQWLWIWKGHHVIMVPIASVWYVVPTENPFNEDDIRAANKSEAEWHGEPLPTLIELPPLRHHVSLDNSDADTNPKPVQSAAFQFEGPTGTITVTREEVKPTIDQAFEVMAMKDDALDPVQPSFSGIDFGLRRAGKGPFK